MWWLIIHSGGRRDVFITNNALQMSLFGSFRAIYKLVTSEATVGVHISLSSKPLSDTERILIALGTTFNLKAQFQSSLNRKGKFKNITLNIIDVRHIFFTGQVTLKLRKLVLSTVQGDS